MSITARKGNSYAIAACSGRAKGMLTSRRKQIAEDAHGRSNALLLLLVDFSYMGTNRPDR
jgi:hypothetical protein